MKCLNLLPFVVFVIYVVKVDKNEKRQNGKDGLTHFENFSVEVFCYLQKPRWLHSLPTSKSDKSMKKEQKSRPDNRAWYYVNIPSTCSTVIAECSLHEKARKIFPALLPTSAIETAAYASRKLLQVH